MKIKLIYITAILAIGVSSYHLFANNTLNKKTMKFLAILEMNDGVSMSDFGPYVKPEADQAWELYKENKLLELFFVKGQNTPILKITASSEKEAWEALNTLPMISNKLFNVTLLQLQPYKELQHHLKANGKERPGWWPVEDF